MLEHGQAVGALEGSECGLVRGADDGLGFFEKDDECGCSVDRGRGCEALRGDALCGQIRGEEGMERADAVCGCFCQNRDEERLGFCDVVDRGESVDEGAHGVAEEGVEEGLAARGESVLGREEVGKERDACRFRGDEDAVPVGCDVRGDGAEVCRDVCGGGV